LDWGVFCLFEMMESKILVALAKLWIQ
jgi:hypothetical protein